MTKLLTKELVTRKKINSFTPMFGMLPNPDKIFRITGRAYEVMRQMKDDPHVWSCIQSRKSGVLSLDYMLTGDNPEMIQLISETLEKLNVQKLIRDILEAPLFGFQPLEVTWKYSGKYILPAKVEAKPQEWFSYNNDNNLVLNKNILGEQKVLPREKLLIPQYEPSYSNPYGHSLLSKCYWPVTFKTGGMRFWVNFTEKYGMPLLIGQYTRGASQEETEKLAEILSNMTEDTVIVTPSDININMHEAAKSTSVDLYKELINHCNSEISKAILSQTLTTELQTGSYSAAQTHFRIRREVILSDVRLVEVTMNTLINYICELNFNSIATPQFKMLVNDSENTSAIERDIKLAGIGLQFSKEYWCKTYGFKPEDILD